MKINLLTPALALAALVFLFLFLWTCQGNKSDKLERTADLNVIQQLQADTSRLKSELRKSTALRQEIAKESAGRRVRDSVALVGLKKANTALSFKLADARKDIQPIIDTSAVVKRFADLSDSTIAQRDTTIAHLETSLASQAADFKREIKAMGEENIKLVELNDTYERFIAKQEKDLAKSERKVRRNRTLAVVFTSIGFAGGVWVGSQ